MRGTIFFEQEQEMQLMLVLGIVFSIGAVVLPCKTMWLSP